ncbi:MAG: hypothetical protein EXS31_01640 [Pedosphaera sp.]|nr:hypothetical protein [Pedosphaera sp.]
MSNWLTGRQCLAPLFSAAAAFALSIAHLSHQACAAEENPAEMRNQPILGLTGKVSDLRVSVPARDTIASEDLSSRNNDLDLKRMAEWALNYLIRTPRQDLGYEPVFQCNPLACPPVPEGQDPVVACDTDARMDWEWYYMRDVTGSTRGREIEAAFHRRIKEYIDPEGRVWSHPGCFNEGNTTAKYEKKDFVIHIWGATKILQSLSEDYVRTQNPESKALARKVMLALKKIATWDGEERCWIKCGMGALRADGSVVPNGWNAQPAPLVGPLVTYWLATSDAEGLQFAKAYAEGVLNNLQPGGIRFQPSGAFNGHSHATMHAVWGIAHLGLVTDHRPYVEFSKRAWDWMLTRGTGTGWFPAGPDDCNETCCISDMISIAALLGKAGHAEYYDYAERYLRNHIASQQFIVTPEFTAYYRSRNLAAGEDKVEKGLAELRKFQGGIIGGSGLNDFENELLGGASGFRMFGCCAPEGMRAIYTAWLNTIERRPKTSAGPAGVYVNMSLNRESPWGRVVSFMPDEGRLTIKAAIREAFFLRPPHWAARTEVRAFIGTKRVFTDWVGDYVRLQAKPGDELTITYPLMEFTHQVAGLWKGRPNLQLTYQWRGNMVTSVNPPAKATPLFTSRPRLLPPPPAR